MTPEPACPAVPHSGGARFRHPARSCHGEPYSAAQENDDGGARWARCLFTQVFVAAVSHLGIPALAGAPYVMAEALVAAVVGLAAWVMRAREAAAPG